MAKLKINDREYHVELDVLMMDLGEEEWIL